MVESPGSRIKQLREEQGISLSELARLASVSKGYLSQVERLSETRPSASTLFALAKALGTSVAALLGEREGHNAEGEGADIPDSLREFAKEGRLPPAEVSMLASIRYRGSSPSSKDDWRYLYESIRRSVNR